MGDVGRASKACMMPQHSCIQAVVVHPWCCGVTMCQASSTASCMVGVYVRTPDWCAPPSPCSWQWSLLQHLLTPQPQLHTVTFVIESSLAVLAVPACLPASSILNVRLKRWSSAGQNDKCAQLHSTMVPAAHKANQPVTQHADNSCRTCATVELCV